MKSLTETNSPQASPWLLVYIFGLVFIQGLLVNHIAVLMPVLEEAFELDENQLGRTASLAFASTFLPLFLSGYVTEWIRPKWSGALAVVVMGVGCIVMGTATSLPIVLLGLVILQFGIPWILAVHSAVISEHFAESRQRLFFCVMGMLALGAIFGPPAIGEAIERVTARESFAAWGKVYLWLGIFLLSLLAVLLLVCGRRIAPLATRASREGADERKETTNEASNTIQRMWDFVGSGIFNRPAFYLLGLMVVFDNLATVNILTWLGVMAKDRFGVGPREIGFLTSLMAVGVLSGRILMAIFVSGRISDRKLLGLSYGLAMFVVMGMIVAPSMMVLYVLYFLMAFFMSAQSAATSAIGAEKLKDRAAVGIPLVDGVGSLGSLAAPLIMGSFAVQFGLMRAMWMIPAFGLMLSVISLGWEWLDKGDTTKPHFG